MRIELDGWRLYPKVRPLAAFAICLLGFAGASAGQASEPASDVYEGSAVCSDGPRYYRVSLEPGDRSPRAVVDVLDGPGGLAWARGFATSGVSFGKTLHSTVSHWHVRPYEQPELPIRFD